MNESTRAAEKELCAYLLSKHLEGDSDFLLTVNPDHVWTGEYKALISDMQTGQDYALLLHGRNRETLLSLIGTTYAFDPRTLDRVVKDEWTRRQIKTIERQAAAAQYGLDELLQLTEGLKRIESGISEGRNSNAAQNFAQALTSDRTIISSGVPKLDRVLGGGFELTEKVVIAARPSGGKTSLAVFLSRLMAESGEPVGFWSIESPDAQIMRRAMASKKALRISDIRKHSKQNPTLSDSQIETLIREAQELENKGFNVFNSNGQTSEQVMMEMFASPHRVCVIDHLQKFRGAEMKISVGNASNHFATVANRKNKVIIMLSQIARSVDTRANDEPKLSDLKESGDIEQDADVVIFIVNASRDAQGNEDIESPVIDVKLIIAKRRDGERGYISLKWNRATGQFFDEDKIHTALF
jgi:replicative DNA helicase